MKHYFPGSWIVLAAGLLVASCAPYDPAPPYYRPHYHPPYPYPPPHGAHPGAGDTRKIENPESGEGRRFGSNPAPNLQNQNPDLGGQPGASPGGSTTTPQPGVAATGILVPNRPGMIMSPYARDPNKLIDVSGLPSGTVIQCPYSEGGRTIRVP